MTSDRKPYSAKKGGFQEDFSTMWKFDECVEIFSEWMDKHYGGVKLKATSNVRQNISFSIKSGDDKGDHSGYIYINEDHNGYSNASMQLYINNDRTGINVATACKELYGDSVDTNPWLQLRKERWNLLNNFDNDVKTKVEISPEQREQDRLQRLAEKAERDAKAEHEYQRMMLTEKLVGIAVAQYVQDLAVNHQHPMYHNGQSVSTPSQHPYGHKKNIDLAKESNDFLIIPNMPFNEQKVYDFVNSDKFQMPINDFGLNKNHVIKEMQNSNFEVKNHIWQSDFKGTGIVASRDINGTVVNLQLYRTNNGQDAEKQFLTGGLVNGGAYVFDWEKTIKDPNYAPKLVIINEGWATGNSVKKAINDPEVLVAVSWNAGQVARCSKMFAEKYPNATIGLATDNDCKSFIKMDQKSTEKKLLKVKNTGLKTSLETIEMMNANGHQGRIGVLMPRFNYKEMTLDGSLSDFNDIDLKYGVDKLREELSREINKFVDRKHNGENECDRIQKMYNDQALFFSEKYQLPVNLIEKNGVFKEEVYTPKGYDRDAVFGTTKDSSKDNGQTITPHVENAVIDNPVASNNPFSPFPMDMKSLFNVEVNDEIKSDFDKKSEQAVAEMLKNQSKELSTPNAQVAEQKLENKEPEQTVYLDEAPKDQPIMKPHDMTEALYKLNLISRFMEFKNIGSNEGVLKVSEEAKFSNQDKLISAIVDPVMAKHIPNVIDKSLDRLKGTRLFDDLNIIKDHIGEGFIKHTAQTFENIKTIQTEVVNTMLPYLDGIGLQRNVADHVVQNDYFNKDIESKRLLFREIASTLGGLTENDSAWVNNVKNTVLDSFKISIKDEEPSKQQEKVKDNGISPM